MPPSKAAGAQCRPVPLEGISLRVVPNARRTQVVGLHGDAIKLKVASPPLDGRANEEIISFLAKTLRLPEKDVILVSGAKSRDKVVRVTSLSAADLRSNLLDSKD